MRRSAALVFLALLASACGGGGGPKVVGLDEGEPPGAIEVYYVASFPPGHEGALGYTDWSEPTVARVYLLEVSGGPSFLITAHELLHAMGLHAHEAGSDCWLRTAPDPALSSASPPHLCPTELARLRACAVPTSVHIMNAEIVGVVNSAMNFLNLQNGTDVYIVAP